MFPSLSAHIFLVFTNHPSACVRSPEAPPPLGDRGPSTTTVAGTQGSGRPRVGSFLFESETGLLESRSAPGFCRSRFFESRSAKARVLWVPPTGYEALRQDAPRYLVKGDE